MRDVKTLIAPYLIEKNHHLTKEDLDHCLATFSKVRKNFTHQGKLKIEGTDLSNQDIKGVDLTKFEISNIKIENTKVDRQQFEYILTYAQKGLINLAFIDIR